MLHIIPENDSPKQILEITLDGVVCNLILDYGERCSRWYASLELVDGTPIFHGLALQNLQRMIIDRRVEGTPPGQLTLYPLTESERGLPGLADWGISHVIGYFNA